MSDDYDSCLMTDLLVRNALSHVIYIDTGSRLRVISHECPIYIKPLNDDQFPHIEILGWAPQLNIIGGQATTGSLLAQVDEKLRTFEDWMNDSNGTGPLSISSSATVPLELTVMNDIPLPRSHCSVNIRWPLGFSLTSMELEMYSRRSHKDRPSDTIRSDDDRLIIKCRESFSARVFSGAIHLTTVSAPVVSINAFDGVVNVGLKRPSRSFLTANLETGLAMVSLRTSESAELALSTEAARRAVVGASKIRWQPAANGHGAVRLVANTGSFLPPKIHIYQNADDGLTRLACGPEHDWHVSWTGIEHLQAPHFIDQHRGRVDQKIEWLSENVGAPWLLSMRVHVAGCDGFQVEDLDTDAVYDFQYSANDATMSRQPLSAWFSAGLLSPREAHFEAHAIGFIGHDDNALATVGDASIEVPLRGIDKGDIVVEGVGVLHKRNIIKDLCNDTARRLVSKLLWTSFKVSARPQSRLLQVVMRSFQKRVSRTNAVSRLYDRWQGKQQQTLERSQYDTFVREVLELENENITSRPVGLWDVLGYAIAVALTLVISTCSALVISGRLREAVSKMTTNQQWHLTATMVLSRRQARKVDEAFSSEATLSGGLAETFDSSMSGGLDSSARWYLTATCVHTPVEGILLRWNANASPFLAVSSNDEIDTGGPAEGDQTESTIRLTTSSTELLRVKIVVWTDLDEEQGNHPRLFYAYAKPENTQYIETLGAAHSVLFIPFQMQTAISLATASALMGLRFRVQVVVLGADNVPVDVSNFSPEQMVPPVTTAVALPAVFISAVADNASFAASLRTHLSSFSLFVRKYLIKSSHLKVILKFERSLLTTSEEYQTGQAFLLAYFLGPDFMRAQRLMLFTGNQCLDAFSVNLGVPSSREATLHRDRSSQSGVTVLVMDQMSLRVVATGYMELSAMYFGHCSRSTKPPDGTITLQGIAMPLYIPQTLAAEAVKAQWGVLTFDWNLLSTSRLETHPPVTHINEASASGSDHGRGCCRQMFCCCCRSNASSSAPSSSDELRMPLTDTYFINDLPANIVLEGVQHMIQWRWEGEQSKRFTDLRSALLSSTSLDQQVADRLEADRRLEASRSSDKPPEAFLYLCAYPSGRILVQLHHGRSIDPRLNMYTWSTQLPVNGGVITDPTPHAAAFGYRPGLNTQLVYTVLTNERYRRPLGARFDHQSFSSAHDPSIKYLCSNAFFIVKAYLMSELDFIYATFCRSENLAKAPLSTQILMRNGITVLEPRVVRVCENVRRRLPFETHWPSNIDLVVTPKCIMLSPDTIVASVDSPDGGAGSILSVHKTLSRTEILLEGCELSNDPAWWATSVQHIPATGPIASSLYAVFDDWALYVRTLAYIVRTGFNAVTIRSLGLSTASWHRAVVRMCDAFRGPDLWTNIIGFAKIDDKPPGSTSEIRETIGSLFFTARPRRNGVDLFSWVSVRGFGIKRLAAAPGFFLCIGGFLRRLSRILTEPLVRSAGFKNHITDSQRLEFVLLPWVLEVLSMAQDVTLMTFVPAGLAVAIIKRLESIQLEAASFIEHSSRIEAQKCQSVPRKTLACVAFSDAPGFISALVSTLR